MKSNKIILDVCCGGRRFWFNQKNPLTLFVDNKKVLPHMVGKGKNARMHSVLPDRVMDFRSLKLPSNSFQLVVFDPPHFTSLGKSSYMALKYGRLNKKTWKEDLTKGFSECFRVLKKKGILVFKWNEHDIPVRDVLALTPVKPLFGHRSGKASKTHWIAFIKI